ncbi:MULTISPECIES: hypothetical protein [Rhodococcus]|uniref:hypothetical protein n=1 Tax=Rhodococcus TaxID=1827 RepID=UPI00193C71BC|nr:MULTISPECIES: hypothetical protein [Rhodococcus]QRI79224.1 hypothetical protein JQ505_28575 [Rhodococcus aetherivorans]QSE62408.1 hypothetical protein JYA75_28370 [Rhodococcus sp. PSBB066]
MLCEHSRWLLDVDIGRALRLPRPGLLSTFDDLDVRIQPTPNYRIPVEIQPKKLVANVLCTAHNNGLSDADRAALAFATFLRDIALRYMNGAGEWGDPEEVEVGGNDLQRWVPELLITPAAADVYTEKGGNRVKTIVPDEAIDLLFSRAEWPRRWGLGVTGDLSNSHLSFDTFARIETIMSDWWPAVPMIKHDPRLLFGGDRRPCRRQLHPGSVQPFGGTVARRRDQPAAPRGATSEFAVLGAQRCAEDGEVPMVGSVGARPRSLSPCNSSSVPGIT